MEIGPAIRSIMTKTVVSMIVVEINSKVIVIMAIANIDVANNLANTTYTRKRTVDYISI